MKTKVNQELNITSLENYILFPPFFFFAIKAVVISPGLTRWKQPASMWRGPLPNLWISKRHYVRAALIQTGLAKHTNTGYSAQHWLKCILPQKAQQLRQDMQFWSINDHLGSMDALLNKWPPPSLEEWS